MPPRVPAPTGAIAPWYAACIPLVAGCLFVGPPWERPVNEPPYITVPASNPEPVYVISDPTNLTVVATDPDLDDLHFEWNVPREYLAEDQVDTELQPGVWASTVAVDWDEVLDGFRARCTITDYQSTPSPMQEWILEVGR